MAERVRAGAQWSERDPREQPDIGYLVRDLRSSSRPIIPPTSLSKRAVYVGKIVGEAATFATAVVCAVLLLIVGGTAAYRALFSAKPATVTLTFTAFEYRDQELKPITSGAHFDALQKARNLWMQEVGEFPMPKLYLEESGCGLHAMACAQPKDNRVFFSEPICGECDETTVMMHEIGHLLGVPHIEGDALMNATYGAPMQRPTPMAVALAKLGRTTARAGGTRE